MAVQLHGRLSRAYKCKSDRTLFVPMRAYPADSGGWELRPFDERGSADIYNIAQANAYVRFEPGEHALDVGAEARFTWMGGGHG